eukprot:m.279255 g.279255  ORF g.279255 m.279255 type:complete len:262 (-) comp140160_c0_seq1:11-796(-)
MVECWGDIHRTPITAPLNVGLWRYTQGEDSIFGTASVSTYCHLSVTASNSDWNVCPFVSIARALAVLTPVILILGTLSFIFYGYKAEDDEGAGVLCVPIVFESLAFLCSLAPWLIWQSEKGDELAAEIANAVAPTGQNVTSSSNIVSQSWWMFVGVSSALGTLLVITVLSWLCKLYTCSRTIVCPYQPSEAMLALIEREAETQRFYERNRTYNDAPIAQCRHKFENATFLHSGGGDQPIPGRQVYTCGDCGRDVNEWQLTT